MTDDKVSGFLAKLPTGKVEAKLDVMGIEKTWKSLIKTHVHLSHPEFIPTISESPLFLDALIGDEDLLEGLSIGQKSILYEFSLAHSDTSSRKNEGQYFTPDDVAIFLAERSDDFKEGVWLDPCSGIGNLSWWLTERQEAPEEFVKNHLRLTDRDPLALLIARALFAISFQKESDNLFAEIEKNFTVLDFLDAENLPAHDYAILNPPYVSVPSDTRFKTFKARDTYAYFLERVIETSKGFISITPQSFVNSSKFVTLRTLLMDNYKAFDIYCFDNIPDSIFKGVKFGSQNTNKANSTRAAVIVAKGDEQSSDGYRITPLLRWLTSERKQMLTSADTFLTPFEPSKEMFPKIGNSLIGLYDNLKGSASGTLKNFLSKKPTEFSLVVPSTPRYFTPAVKRELVRSSYKTLYFNNAEDRDKFYVYLNSSILYWWWRVVDGGMTLSLLTLETLPIIDSWTGDADLAQQLKESEQENLVCKMNAGKPNENVKHDLGLIAKINETVCPEYADALLHTHKNSYL